MEQIKARPGRALQLGYAGEHQVRQIIFDLAPFAELGTGTAELVISLPDDDRRYPVRLEQDGTTATWTVGRGEVPTAGQGRAQLNYLVDGRVAKTEVWPTWVKPSLSATEDAPPEAQQGWVDQVLAAGISAAKDAGRAEAAAKEAVDTAKGIKDISQQVQQVDRDAAAAKADAAKAKTQADRAADASHQTGLDRAAVEEAVAQLAPMAEQVSKDKAAAEGAAADAAGHAAAAKADADRAGAAALALIDDQVLSADHVLSSKRTADLLGDPFTVSGPIVTCQPVEGYPLDVAGKITAQQEGKGDPSPSNVRPIKIMGTVTRCGANCFNFDDFRRNYVGIVTGTPESFTVQRRGPVTTQYACHIPCARITGHLYADRFDGVVVAVLSDGKQVVLIEHYGTGPSDVMVDKLVDPASIVAIQFTFYGKSGQLNFEKFALNSVSETVPYAPYHRNIFGAKFGGDVYTGDYSWSTGQLTAHSKLLTLRVADMDNDDEYPGWRAVPGVGGDTGAGDGTSYLEVQCSAGICICNTQKQNAIIFIGKSGMTQSQWKERYPDLTVDVLVPYREDLRPVIQLEPQIIPALPGINTVYADTGDVTVTGVRKTVGAPGPGPGPGPDQPVDPGALDQYVQQAKGHADRAEDAAHRTGLDRAAVEDAVAQLAPMADQVQADAQQVSKDRQAAEGAAAQAGGAAGRADQAAAKTQQDRQAVAEAVAGLPAQIRQATEAAEQASADADQTGKDKLAAEAARQGADSAKAAADQSAKTAKEQADRAAGDLAGHNADPAAHEDIRKAVSQLNESLGAYLVKKMSETTAELKPNVEYRWGEVASLSVTLGAEKPGITNEYRMRFISGSSPTVLSVPSTVRWITPLKVEAGKTYEVSIEDGLGVICGAAET